MGGIAGTTLTVNGSNSGFTALTASGLTLNAGTSSIVINANGGSGTVLNLGTVTQAAGGIVNFTQPTGTQSSTNGITGTFSNYNSNIIVGGTTKSAYATVNATDFAYLSGTNVVPVSNYKLASTGMAGNTQIADVDANATSGGSTPQAVRFNQAGFTLNNSGGSMNLQTGGILATAAGTGCGISGGSISTLNGATAVNVIDYGSLSISAAIVNSGGTVVALVKAGTGTTTLTGASTYSGNTYLAAGYVQVGATETAGTSGPLGKANTAGTILFSGGGLQFSAANTNDYSNRFSIAGNQPIKIDTNSQPVTFGTAIQGVGTSLNKVGAGMLTLSNANNSYSGPTTVNGGTLAITGA